MQIIRRPWKLSRTDCPCDLDFLDWIANQDLEGRTIFHFGTGDHHVVGLECARSDRDNAVIGVTASPREHDAYVKLARTEPEITKRYVVLFGDIYNTNPRLLPPLDVVTLFHLCEFTDEKATYRALDDAGLVRTLGDQVRPGGWMVFYTRSYAYARVAPILDAWAGEAGFTEAEGFRTLRVFRRG